LSEMKSNLMVNNARMKAELSLLEDTILQMLSASQGNILDDENLINTLAVSKVYNAALAGVTLGCKRMHCDHWNAHLLSDSATHLAITVTVYCVSCQGCAMLDLSRRWIAKSQLKHAMDATQ